MDVENRSILVRSRYIPSGREKREMWDPYPRQPVWPIHRLGQTLDYGGVAASGILRHYLGSLGG